jgi:hypothetical protein
VLTAVAAELTNVHLLQEACDIFSAVPKAF